MKKVLLFSLPLCIFLIGSFLAIARAQVTKMPLLVIPMEYTNDSYDNDNGTPDDDDDDWYVPGRHDDIPPGTEGFFTRDNGSLERNILYGQIFGGDEVQYPVFPREIDGVPTSAAHVNGERRCMNDYFKEISGGAFYFDEVNSYVSDWVSAWDDPGTPEDESTAEYWRNSVLGGAGKRMWWALLSLNKAHNDNFDFAQWDANGDGHIMLGNINYGGELAVLMINTHFGHGGCARWISDNEAGDPPQVIPGWPPAEFVLNGIAFSSNSHVALANGECFEDTNAGMGVFNPFYIAAHELGHSVFSFADTYGKKMLPDKVLFGLYGGYRGPYHLDPYQKKKAGWLNTTVVSQDGWYDIPDVETTNQAFLLQDPAHGEHEYFLVENRFAGDSYDDPSLNFTPERHTSDALKDYIIPDEGLFVWHIDQNANENDPRLSSVIQLVHRDGLPGHGTQTEHYYYRDAAFSADDPKLSGDPPYYDFHDDSSPTSARWWDGSESRCGIWAISQAGKTMKAFFDVPGPGVFIQRVGDQQKFFTPGADSTVMAVRIVNTGDASAAFDVDAAGLASPLTVSNLPASVVIPAKTASTVAFNVFFNGAMGGFNDVFIIRAEQTNMQSVMDEIEIEVSVCDTPSGPPIPTFPKGNYVDGTSTTLYWQYASDTATHYEVEVCEDSDCSEVIRSVEVDTKTWQVSPILGNNDTWYYWRVKAHDNCGTSTWSATESFRTICDAVVPEVPTLRAPANGETGLAVNIWLEWNEVPDATSYEVVISKANDADNVVRTLHVTEENEETACGPASWMCKQIAPDLEGGDYQWRVRALNQCAASDFSVSWFFSTLDKPILTDPYDGAYHISTTPTFTWQPVDGAVKYTIEVSHYEDFDNVRGAGIIYSTEWEYDDNPLSHNMAAYWRVRAHNDDFNRNSGPWSTTGQFVTCAPLLGNQLPNPFPPNGATDVMVPVTVDWDAVPAGNVTYEVKVYDDCDGSGGIWLCSGNDMIASADGLDSTQWTIDPPLELGKDYWWKVIVYHNCGSRVFYNNKFTTTACPVPQNKAYPTYPVNSAEVSTTPTLEWDYPFGGGYTDKKNVQVYSDMDCTALVTEGTDIVGQSWEVTPDLDEETQYWWRVRLVNVCGNGSWSWAYSFVTTGALDYDEDGIVDARDNCVVKENPDQEDLDGDGVGDVCDPDMDGDGIERDNDNCPDIPNGPDGGTCLSGNIGASCLGFEGCLEHCDGILNKCLSSCDHGDGSCENQCQIDYSSCADDCNEECGTDGVCSTEQEDTDNDGLGDVCDDCPSGLDTDYDGVCDEYDNCSEVPNGPEEGRCIAGNIGAPCSVHAFEGCMQSCEKGWIRCQLRCLPTDQRCMDQCGDDYDICKAGCDDGCGSEGVCSQGQEDTDRDGTGDVCDICLDKDTDGICDENDNCPEMPNGPDMGTCIAGNVGDICNSSLYDNCTLLCEGNLVGCLNTCGPLDPFCEYTCQNIYASCINGCQNGCGKDGHCSQGQEDSDGDGTGDVCDGFIDGDTDGVCDSSDNCPDTPNSDQRDSDSDGIGDWCDPCNDRDGDSICDGSDPCPLDPENDVDNDTVCGDIDNCPDVSNKNQADVDHDGVGDVCDNCPDHSNKGQEDSDGDGEGDACDFCLDKDSDTVCDDVDNCPTVNNMNQVDGDNDGVGDSCDNCPATRNPDQADRDGDGTGDACSDLDRDGENDSDDNCPDIPNANQNDHDGDTVGDACDNCPSDENRYQVDADSDGIGNACDPCTDKDRDGVCDVRDNCPDAGNPDQLDWDGNGIGDACDTCRDRDWDGICDHTDNCPEVFNPYQADRDRDDLGDACDACPLDPGNDRDGDRLCAEKDNCPDVANADQRDVDRDGLGDLCDPCPFGDRDWDGVCDDVDNCPVVVNSDQGDIDRDGVGDACDPCRLDPHNDSDRDGLCGNIDNCPDVPNEDQKDSDDDNLGDECDACPFDFDHDGDMDGSDFADFVEDNRRIAEKDFAVHFGRICSSPE